MSEQAKQWIDQQVNALVQSVSRLLGVAVEQYEAQFPQQFRHLERGVREGSLQLGVDVQVTPRVVLQAYGIGPDGQRHVFATIPVNEVGAPGLQ